jgi:HEAT repeat protein
VIWLAPLLLLLAGPVTARQSPAAPDVKSAIDHIGDIDYDARMKAARAVRRAPAPEAIAALTAAVRGHADQYVRYRALVLLTAFNDSRTGETMRSVLRDRNDRLREVAYAWFERHPDPKMAPLLIAALDVEEAEFVRPALVGALAAIGSEPQVRSALLREAGRGLDAFRSTVIEALGEHRAEYALDTLAAIAKLDGPLQDDAVLALGRIGGARAGSILAEIAKAPPDVRLSIRGSQCLLGSDCPAHIDALVSALTGRESSDDGVRAAAAALSALATQGNVPATQALVGATPARDIAGDEIALALAAAALRNPAHVLQWLERAPEADRARAVERLRDGFDMLQEDYAEESFFAAARAAYWKASEGSTMRTVAATLIDKLDF